MTDYQQQLHKILAHQAHTIQQYTLDNGEIVWVRKVGKTIPAWRYRLLDCIANTLKLYALKPVPNLGGYAAIETEVHRLTELNNCGILVPRLLAHTSDGLMFSHLGEHTLLHFIENSTNRLHYFQQGLEAIANVHNKNQCLSQAFARNIIMTNNNHIGVIDFEDNPAAYLPLLHCQSRDYLCYIQSTAIWLQQHQQLNDARRIWQEHAQFLPSEMIDLINQSVSPIRWLRHLKASFWGSDTLRLTALAALFTPTTPPHQP